MTFGGDFQRKLETVVEENNNSNNHRSLLGKLKQKTRWRDNSSAITEQALGLLEKILQGKTYIEQSAILGLDSPIQKAQKAVNEIISVQEFNSDIEPLLMENISLLEGAFNELLKKVHRKTFSIILTNTGGYLAIKEKDGDLITKTSLDNVFNYSTKEKQELVKRFNDFLSDKVFNNIIKAQNHITKLEEEVNNNKKAKIDAEKESTYRQLMG